jgi:hypothetical protein
MKWQAYAIGAHKQQKPPNYQREAFVLYLTWHRAILTEGNPSTIVAATAFHL